MRRDKVEMWRKEAKRASARIAAAEQAGDENRIVGGKMDLALANECIVWYSRGRTAGDQ